MDPLNAQTSNLANEITYQSTPAAQTSNPEANKVSPNEQQPCEQHVYNDFNKINSE